MAHCQSCGTQVQAGEQFCPECGEPVQSGQVAASDGGAAGAQQPAQGGHGAQHAGGAPTRDDTDVIGARIGAQIIDTIVMAILFWGILFVFGTIAGAVESGGLGLLTLVLAFVSVISYGFLLEGLWDGYTVGKKVFGIKVVKEDGSPCDLGAAFVRNLLRIIDSWFYYAVGFVFMAMSDKRQRLGDRVAGTVVVNDSRF